MSISRNNKEVTLNKLFTGINEVSINNLYNNDNFVEKSEGEIIYQTGDESKNIYLLLRGDVKIKFPTYHFVSNKIFNDFFGEKELLDKTRRVSSAVADTRCLLYTISKSQFEKLISNSDTFKKNIETYGDIKLPDMHLNSSAELSFAQNSKPISFKAIVNNDTSDVPRDSSAESEIEKSIDNLSISDILNKGNPFVSKELADEISTSKTEVARPTINLEGNPEISVSKDSLDEEISSVIGETPLEINTQPKINAPQESKVNIKYLLATLLSIHSRNNLIDTIESIKNAVMQLTKSEACELFLVDIDAGSMKKYLKEGSEYRTVEFKISEGLTGTSVLQKKIINFENPSEDSRFNPEIDLPSSYKADRIIYFPVFNEGNELVAVLQLARIGKLYAEQEISELKLLANQIALAIERSTIAGIIAQDDKQILLNDLSDLLNRNIEIPIELINKYSSYLNQEEFSEKLKEVIAMLQKQANSFWDIFKSTFDYATNRIEIQPENVSLNTFINETSELLSEYCTARKIELFRKTGDDVNLKFDPGNIYMALYQIIITACDNSVDSHSVYLSTEIENETAYIIIQDEGEGYSDDQIKSFLSPLHNSSRRNLGLSLAKKFVEINKGEFSINSKDSKGTAFRIQFPVTAEDENNPLE